VLYEVYSNCASKYSSAYGRLVVNGVARTQATIPYRGSQLGHAVAEVGTGVLLHSNTWIETFPAATTITSQGYASFGAESSGSANVHYQTLTLWRLGD
jgi:hypothetical protein